jgi:hypothetical protein
MLMDCLHLALRFLRMRGALLPFPVVRNSAVLSSASLHLWCILGVGSISQSFVIWLSSNSVVCCWMVWLPVLIIHLMTLARSCLTSPITSCYLQCCTLYTTLHCCYNNRHICCMRGRYDVSIVQLSFADKMTFIRIDSRLKSEPKQLCNNLALCRCRLCSQTINCQSFSSKTNRKCIKWFGQSPLANPLIMLMEWIQEIKLLSFVLHASWWNLTVEVQRKLCAMCAKCAMCAMCWLC